MKNIFKLNCRILVIILALNYAANAQSTDLKWGVSSQVKIQGVSQVKGNEDINSANQEPVTIGAFIQYKNLNATIDLLANTASVDVKYFFRNRMYVALQGNWDAHNYEIYNWGQNNNDSSVDDVDVYSYLAGIGYQHTFFNRLKCQGTALGGIMHSSKEKDSEIISGGYYSNLRAESTNSYQLKPTFVYGGVIHLDLLPNPSKNRLRPITPFISVGVTGTKKSRTYRKVSIDEWVKGNLVYTEENRPNDRLYSLKFSDVRLGLKIYLKK